MLIGLWILAFVVIVLVMIYNSLIKKKNTVENAFSDIDVQLKARFNLMDNLVSTVKGYAIHEKELLENVTNARSAYMNAKDDGEKVEADNMLTGTLKTLFAVSENYPDLKANQNFMMLQTELSDIENKVAASRRYYNSAVREYENQRETFPSNIIANMFGFGEKSFFDEVTAEERKVPKVQF